MNAPSSSLVLKTSLLTGLGEFMRATVIVSAMCLGAMGLAMAADLQAAIRTPTSIEAQSLGAALQELARKREFQIVYRPEFVRDRRTPGVSGELTPEEALTGLLSGTGLTFHYLNEKTVTIVPLPSGVPEHAPGAVGKSSADAAVGTSRNAESARDRMDLEEIVVTGSHIRGSEAASPVITLDRAYIERSGFHTAGDVLRSLPQSFSGGLNVGVVGAGGSANVQSTSGASTANLRGLGSESTLTLVDGHRLAYAEGVSAVDVSLIPLAAIERVEVLTDGASAIYGSEAVGGVVNFIMRTNFEGVNAGAAWGTSSDGGGTLHRYDLLGGKRWAGGHALLSYELSRQDAIDSADRNYISPIIAGTTLIPETERNSVFVDAAQGLGDRVNLSFKGLYTRRDANSVNNLSPYLSGLVSERRSDVEQYGVALSGSMEISSTWRAALTADVSGNHIDTPMRSTIDGAPNPGASTGSAARTRLRAAELNADGVLFTLPTGTARLATGAGYREETTYSAVFPLTSPAIAAQRQIRHVFAETLIPLVSRSAERTGLNALELSVAARYEDYSDFGSSSNPKVGLIYCPTPTVDLRLSWGKSFRAPSLLQEYNPSQAYYLSLPDADATSGATAGLLRFGGNPLLQPERANAYTADLSVTPTALPGARFQLTAYELRYENRIGFPFQNSFAALSDPYGTLFVERDPAVATVANIVAQSQFFNFIGGSFDPATVRVVVDNRYLNASRQNVSGLDALARYQRATLFGHFDWSLNVAYLDLRQHLTPTSPEQTLSGTIYNPPKFHGRAGVSWERRGWSASAFVNHIGTSMDPAASPRQPIASWTTLDGSMSYAFQSEGPLQDTRVALSAQNIADRRPPFVEANQSSLPGIHFDATNASAIGRFMTLELTKKW
jgi:outer membrane receptor protein involved in Fe transport